MVGRASKAFGVHGQRRNGCRFFGRCFMHLCLRNHLSSCLQHKISSSISVSTGRAVSSITLGADFGWEVRRSPSTSGPWNITAESCLGPTCARPYFFCQRVRVGLYTRGSRLKGHPEHDHRQFSPFTSCAENGGFHRVWSFGYAGYCHFQLLPRMLVAQSSRRIRPKI